MDTWYCYRLRRRLWCVQCAFASAAHHHGAVAGVAAPLFAEGPRRGIAGRDGPMALGARSYRQNPEVDIRP